MAKKRGQCYLGSVDIQCTLWWFESFIELQTIIDRLIDCWLINFEKSWCYIKKLSQKVSYISACKFTKKDSITGPRIYFRKVKPPRIGDFVKSALFEKNMFFLIQIKLIKNNFQLRGFNLYLSFWIVQVAFSQTKVRWPFVETKSLSWRALWSNSFILEK